MSAGKQEKWYQIIAENEKDCHSTVKLLERYSDLRAAFIKAGGTLTGIMPTIDASDIALEMQALEREMLTLWEPHRELVGPCGTCDATRIPSSFPEGVGFGCLRCHDIEIFVERETRP